MYKISYKNDEYIYREYFRYTLFRRPHLFAFWLILISTYFMQLARNKGSWELVSFFPLFMFMQMYIYRSKVKTAYKKACDLAGEGYVYTFIADDEKIYFHSTEGISYDIHYERLRSYALTGGILIIFTMSERYYILPLDSFSEGNYKDFIAHLDAKAVRCETKGK